MRVDALGNLTAQGTVAYTYPAVGQAHPHAVTALSTGVQFQYDLNGNMTRRIEGGVTSTQTFDLENRLGALTTITGTTTFVYDGDGQQGDGRHRQL